MAGRRPPYDDSLEVAISEWLYQLTDTDRWEPFPGTVFDREPSSQSGESLEKLCRSRCVEVLFAVRVCDAKDPDDPSLALRVWLAGTGCFVRDWRIASDKLIEEETKRLAAKELNKRVMSLDADGQVCWVDRNGNAVAGESSVLTNFAQNLMLIREQEIHQPTLFEIAKRAIPRWKSRFCDSSSVTRHARVCHDEASRVFIEPEIQVRLTSHGQKARQAYLDDGWTPALDRVCGTGEFSKEKLSGCRLNVVRDELVTAKPDSTVPEGDLPEPPGADDDAINAAFDAIPGFNYAAQLANDSGGEGEVESGDDSKHTDQCGEQDPPPNLLEYGDAFRRLESKGGLGTSTARKHIAAALKVLKKQTIRADIVDAFAAEFKKKNKLTKERLEEIVAASRAAEKSSPRN